jgi:RNA polymerase sigma factor for flagellar operon FliA
MSTNIYHPASPQLIVQNYFNLVQSIANRIKRRLPAHVDVEDLVQTGMIGLLEASSRYDAARTPDFSSYANSRITGAILDELRKWDSCSRQDRRNSRRIEDAKAQLRAAMNTEPSKEEVAEAVGLGLAEYDRLLHRLESSKHPNLQTEEQDGEAGDEVGQLPAKDASPVESLLKREDLTLLDSYIRQLKPRQREILQMYYFENVGMKQIGERLGVGETRICQIHKEIIAELRAMLTSRKRNIAPRVSNMIQ